MNVRTARAIARSLRRHVSRATGISHVPGEPREAFEARELAAYQARDLARYLAAHLDLPAHDRRAFLQCATNSRG